MATRKNKRNITIPVIQEINRLYTIGYNMVMISKALKISHGSVCKYVYSPRKSGTYTDIRGISL